MHLPNPGAGENGSPEIEFRQVWNTLRRQWLIVISLTAVAVAGALFAIPKPEPVYTASAVIRVEEAGGPLAGLAGGGRSNVATEIEVIRSRSVAGAVVDSLNLQVRVRLPEGAEIGDVFAAAVAPMDVTPGSYRFLRETDGRYSVTDVVSDSLLGNFAAGNPINLRGAVFTLPAENLPAFVEVDVYSRESAIDAILSRLRVSQPSRQADIIRIEFDDRNPRMARDIPNAVVSRFLVARNDAQKTEVRSTADFLRSQVSTVAGELAAADEQLRAFREQYQVIDPVMEGGTQVRRLAEMQAERSALEAERATLLALVEEVEQSSVGPGINSASRYRRLGAFPKLMQSYAFSNMLSSLTTLETERNALSIRRRPEDQDVQLLTTRIVELEEQIRSFVLTYLSGLSSQVASLDAALAGFEQQITRIPGTELEFARLSREPRVLGEMYALLQTRLKEAEIAQAVEDASIRVVDRAVIPASPAPSRGWHLKVLAVSMLGLMLGLMAGFAREYSDHAVYTRFDVQGLIGLPVLGMIPNIKSSGWLRSRTPYSGKELPRRRLNGKSLPKKSSGNGTAITRGEKDHLPVLMPLLNDNGPNPVFDAYDRLNTNIMFASVQEKETRVLLLTSPLPGDGKTTTAVNLAIAFVRRGLRTLLIDCDLRRGSVSTIFDVARGPGLTELLGGVVPSSRAIRELAVNGESKLYYLPTGELPVNPVSVLESPAMAALISRFQPHFDRIVIDSPPINIVVDPTILAGYADGVLLVARAGTTPQEALTLAAEQFNQAGIPVVGVVLNGVDFDRHGSYDPAYRSYSYGKKYYAGNPVS